MNGQSPKDEALTGFAGKSGLEQTLQAGIHGAPELHKEEKNRFLGEFRERVLRMLTRSQVGEPVAYPEIESALKDPRASYMVVHGDISSKALDKYKKLAQAAGKPVTARHDEDFAGETGLVVVSKSAVYVEQVEVEGRREKLRKRGLPEQLIDAAGEAVCKDCYHKVQELAPEELKHYRLIPAISRLLGEDCPGHE
ncbi:YueI family protein [Gorillibacterium sp. sgz5001074]|uniref:YueI family protein n=1 Tax=Gorillibacterium sp. sgz5001074 TaxID=3446695 RepID=UPI003F668005